MSGGVDSSVSACLLKKAGYDITGVFIKVWQPDWLECNWREERLEAMRVCAHLEIPFITLDLEQEYKKGVIDYMIAEYSVGRTPNPDVMCNREVKFGAFWKWAKENGADFIATGHYAKNIITASGNYLHAGTDKNKDQSYFLWTLNKDDLAHTLFPVGHLTKPDVRKLATSFKLPNADKKDSQGLCFIGKLDVKDFLSHYIKSEKGNVLNEKGEVIGTHSGSLFLTIGERHGFDITKKTPNDEPYYIVSKDIKANTVTVGHRVSADSSNVSGNLNQVKINRINWVNRVPKVGDNLQARSRYRQPLQNIKILNLNKNEVKVEFKTKQETLTPGQSLVIYDGEECLGGGVIL